jgi:hypothetical protein
VLTRHDGDLDWIRAAVSGAGRVVERRTFADRFGLEEAGWRHFGGARPPLVRGDALVATLRDAKGAIGTALDWVVPEDGERYVLAIEASGEDLTAARVSLGTGSAADTDLSTGLVLAEGLDDARITTLDLPPGHYRALTLSATPTARTGTLRLFGWRVLALAREEI